MESFISWYGGKHSMAKRIIALMPKHDVYVEVFGGGAHVILNKKRSNVEVYNDLNKGLFALFNTIRDKEKAKIFKDKIEMTLYSRNEFDYALENWENEEDEVEKARLFYILCMQSFSAGLKSWKCDKAHRSASLNPTVKRWLNNINESLPYTVARFRTVQVENQSYEKILEKYDSKDTCFYLDPPYIHDTRGKSAREAYHHEMDNSMHKEMVDRLLEIKGTAIVSGYDHPIYDRISEGEWQKVFLGDIAKTCQKSEAGGIKDRGQEYLWINFKPGAYQVY